jgi:hypothetical protein
MYVHNHQLALGRCGLVVTSLIADLWVVESNSSGVYIHRVVLKKIEVSDTCLENYILLFLRKKVARAGERTQDLLISFIFSFIFSSLYRRATAAPHYYFILYYISFLNFSYS